jgi:hypothetical protein
MTGKPPDSEVLDFSIERREIVDEGVLLRMGLPKEGGLFTEKGEPFDPSKLDRPTKAFSVRRVSGGYLVETRLYSKTLRFRLRTWEAEVRQNLQADGGMVAVKLGPRSWRISVPRRSNKIPVRARAEAYGDALLVDCAGETRFWFRRGGRLEWFPAHLCDACGKPIVSSTEVARAVGEGVEVGYGRVCLSCALERKKRMEMREPPEDESEEEENEIHWQ